MSEAEWRGLPPTKRQLEYIADICEFSTYGPPRFMGATRGEAADWLDRYATAAHDDPSGFGFGY